MVQIMCEHGRDHPGLCPHCLGANSAVLDDLCEHDLGGGVVIRWDSDGRGIAWTHPACRAWATLRFTPDPSSTGHALVRGSPTETDRLTIGGSLLCPMGCGMHGVIEDGRWRTI